MKIILNDFVAHLGAPGDEVNVAPGYARNYLLPKKLAVEATEGNRKTYENNLRHRARKLVKIKSEAEVQKEKIDALEALVFTRKSGEEGKLFGSVTSGDIEEALTEKGFRIERKQIELKSPIKLVSQTAVTIKIFSGVKAVVTVVVQAEAAPEPVVEKEAADEEETATPEADTMADVVVTEEPLP